jgi:hypothetical protein
MIRSRLALKNPILPRTKAKPRTVRSALNVARAALLVATTRFVKLCDKAVQSESLVHPHCGILKDLL